MVIYLRHIPGLEGHKRGRDDEEDKYESADGDKNVARGNSGEDDEHGKDADRYGNDERDEDHREDVTEPADLPDGRKNFTEVECL